MYVAASVLNVCPCVVSPAVCSLLALRPSLDPSQASSGPDFFAPDSHAPDSLIGRVFSAWLELLLLLLQSLVRLRFLTDEGVGDGDLQPHAVPDLQAGLGVGHGRHHGRHVAVDGQVMLLVDAWQTHKR